MYSLNPEISGFRSAEKLKKSNFLVPALAILPIQVVVQP